MNWKGWTDSAISAHQIKNVQMNNTGSFIVLCVDNGSNDTIYMTTLNTNDPNNITYNTATVILPFDIGEHAVAIDSITVENNGVLYFLYAFSTLLYNQPQSLFYLIFELDADENFVEYIDYRTVKSNTWITSCSWTYTSNKDIFLAVRYNNSSDGEIWRWRSEQSIINFSSDNLWLFLNNLDIVYLKFMPYSKSLTAGTPTPLLYTAKADDFGNLQTYIIYFENSTGNYRFIYIGNTLAYNSYYFSNVYLSNDVNTDTDTYYYFTTYGDGSVAGSNLYRISFVWSLTQSPLITTILKMCNNGAGFIYNSYANSKNFATKTQQNSYFINSQLGYSTQQNIPSSLFGSTELLNTQISTFSSSIYYMNNIKNDSDNLLKVLDPAYSPTPAGTYVDYNYYAVNSICGSNYIDSNDNLPKMLITTSPFVNGYLFFSMNGGGACFIKDTLITILENGLEIQKEVQYLKCDDLVKINENEYKKIVFIGENKLDIFKKMDNIKIIKKDTISKNIPCKDTLLTSGHSVLFEDLNNVNEFYNSNVYTNNISGFYKMMTQHCKLFNDASLEDISYLIKKNNIHYYHFSLENEDKDGQYAIYSNNIRSESMSIRFIKYSGLIPINVPSNNNLTIERPFKLYV